MVGRHKIYKDVDIASAKNEWVKMACDLFENPYDDRNKAKTSHKSIKEISKIMHISEVKVKKLLIEGGYYSTKETRSVADLQSQGLSVEQIAKELNMSVPKVRTLMSYKYGRLYGIGTNSAQRNRVYRERKGKQIII